MGKTYSVDLREKVIKYLEEGGQKQEAVKIFHIGIDTVYRWVRLKKSSDSLSAKKRTSFHQVVEPEKLKAYVADHPDHTIVEIAQALSLGRQTVCRWLHRLKITRKKRPRTTKNAKRKTVPFSKSS